MDRIDIKYFNYCKRSGMLAAKSKKGFFKHEHHDQHQAHVEHPRFPKSAQAGSDPDVQAGSASKSH